MGWGRHNIYPITSNFQLSAPFPGMFLGSTQRSPGADQAWAMQLSLKAAGRVNPRATDMQGYEFARNVPLGLRD